MKSRTARAVIAGLVLLTLALGAVANTGGVEIFELGNETPSLWAHPSGGSGSSAG